MAVILVLEDDPALASMLRAVFEDEGYSVVGAATHADAVREAARQPCDLIVADAVWGRDAPAIDAGAAALRDASAAPILLCTADANLARPDTDALGIAAVVLKPFDLQALLDIVARLVAGAPEA